MIHILTVHWRDGRWIDIQRRYLARHVGEPYRIYASLTGEPERRAEEFDYSETVLNGSHASKLNRLAQVATESAEKHDDLLVFLDGDAFPIDEIIPYCRRHLESYPLLAVQRLENHGDIQPHPSFCATTVDFWNQIEGDWERGHTWKDRKGAEVTDVGGNLLAILESKDVSWYPMHRSNRLDLHPVWFGIYDDVVYHHGAGFRRPDSRADIARARSQLEMSAPYAARKVLWSMLSGTSLGKRLRRRLDPERWMFDVIYEEVEEIRRAVFEDIQEDEHFFLRFLPGAECTLPECTPA